MSVVHLPEYLVGRLAVEADRRGISVDELATQALGARFPRTDSDDSGDALEGFIASRDSGDPAWAATDTAELRKQAAARHGG